MARKTKKTVIVLTLHVL